MTITPIHPAMNAVVPSNAPVRHTHRHEAFPDPRRITREPRAAGDSPVRNAAEQLVASAFLVPMLAEVRDSSFGVGAFAPNIVEKRFGPMLDQQIADHVISAGRLGLVDAIVERLETQHASLGMAQPLLRGAMT